MLLKKFQWLFLLFTLLTIPLQANPRDFVVTTPRYEAGMFSHFLTTIGLLHYYDKGYYQGVKVDFASKGLYYVPEMGSNWWEYYFYPMQWGDSHKANVKVYTWDECISSSYIALYNISRHRCHELLNKYILIKPEFTQEADAFAEKHLTAPYIIGVHYRGTDKITSKEARFVSYADVTDAVNEVINFYKIKDYQIFVATDELKFLNYMKICYPGRIVHLDAMRSSSDQAVHIGSNDPFRVGKEALVDALILAKSDFLIRTISNLSYCSSIFNPDMAVRVLQGKVH